MTKQTLTHNPTTWAIKDYTIGIDIVDAKDKTIAILSANTSGEIAALIAAAPETRADRDRLKAQNAELLAALKATHVLLIGVSEAVYGLKGYKLTIEYDMVVNAIAKAEGDHV